MSSPFATIVTSGGLGVVAGILSGFMGIGGGAVLTPALVFALGIGQHRAQGISLAALLPPVGLPAVLAYRWRGVSVDVRLVLLLIAGFLGGAAAGAWLAHRVPARELAWLFAGFLVVSAWRGLTQAAEEAAHDGAANGAALTSRRRLGGLPIGAAAGVLSGLLGIGGGLVALPLLRRLGLPRQEAQATTLAMMLPPIGLPAVYVYAMEQGGLPWSLLVAVGLGFAAGAGAGALLAGKVKSGTATKVYSGFLVIMAVLLVVRA